MIEEPNRGPKRPTRKTPGFGGGDLNSTGMTSVKGLRTKDSQNPAPVNVKTRTGLTTGRLDGDHTSRAMGLAELPALPAHNPKGPQNRRNRAKLRRALKAAKTAR